MYWMKEFSPRSYWVGCSHPPLLLLKISSPSCKVWLFCLACINHKHIVVCMLSGWPGFCRKLSMHHHQKLSILGTAELAKSIHTRGHERVLQMLLKNRCSFHLPAGTSPLQQFTFGHQYAACNSGWRAENTVMSRVSFGW